MFILTLCTAAILYLVLMRTSTIFFMIVPILATLQLLLSRYLPHHFLSLSLIQFTIIPFVFFDHHNTTTNHFTDIYYTRSNHLALIRLYYLFFRFTSSSMAWWYCYSFHFWNKFPPPSYFKFSPSKFFLALHHFLSFLSPLLPSSLFLFQ